MIVALISLAVIANPAAPMSRIEFTRRLALIKQGDPPSRVISILGKPDDIWTRDDPTTVYVNLWCYGSSGHLKFPTLGVVAMMEPDGAYPYLGQGTPPASSEITEAELRSCLSRLYDLDQDNPLTGGRYLQHDPLSMIRAANLLIGLGRRKAVAVIREYIRITGYMNHYALMGIMNCLYKGQPEPGFNPQPGELSIPPKDQGWGNYSMTYRYLLRKDIPFRIELPYWTVVRPDVERTRLDWLEKNAVFRKRPLSPSAEPYLISDSLLAEFCQGYYGMNISSRSTLGDRLVWLRSDLVTQSLLLTRGAWQPPLKDDEPLDFATNSLTAHLDMPRDYRKVKGRWDPKLESFVTHNRSPLSEDVYVPRPPILFTWTTPQGMVLNFKVTRSEYNTVMIDATSNVRNVVDQPPLTLTTRLHNQDLKFQSTPIPFTSSFWQRDGVVVKGINTGGLSVFCRPEKPIVIMIKDSERIVFQKTVRL